jgi:hypothetical protein
MTVKAAVKHWHIGPDNALFLKVYYSAYFQFMKLFGTFNTFFPNKRSGERGKKRLGNILTLKRCAKLPTRNSPAAGSSKRPKKAKSRYNS